MTKSNREFFFDRQVVILRLTHVPGVTLEMIPSTGRELVVPQLLQVQARQQIIPLGMQQVGIRSFLLTKEKANSVPNGKILEWLKLKVFAGNNLNVAKMMIPVIDRIENIVGKGQKVQFFKCSSQWQLKEFENK